MLILLLEEGRVRLASKNNQRLFLKARLRFAECEPIRLETERLQGKHRNMIHMIIWKSVGKGKIIFLPLPPFENIFYGFYLLNFLGKIKEFLEEKYQKEFKKFPFHVLYLIFFPIHQKLVYPPMGGGG